MQWTWISWGELTEGVLRGSVGGSMKLRQRNLAYVALLSKLQDK